jgi:hypothetical protein
MELGQIVSTPSLSRGDQFSPVKRTARRSGLLLVIAALLITTVTLLRSLGLLSPNTTRSATTKGTGQREVDVLLAVQTNNEAGDVDDLFADTDVALLDEDTGVVDRLGETELVDTGLEAALQEIFDLEGEYVIEFHTGFVEHTDSDETSNEGVAFEETLGVLFVEGQKLTAHSVVLVHVVLHTILQDNLRF